MGIIDWIIGFVVAGIATLTFAMLFNMPKSELWLCGLTGSVGWLVLNLVLLPGSILGINMDVGATMCAAVVITLLSRVLAFRRKIPLTVYLIGGIIPLVPGFGVYYTMFYLINNQYDMATVKGIETLKIAGVIGVGIMAVFALPWKWFLIPSEWKKAC